MQLLGHKDDNKETLFILNFKRFPGYFLHTFKNLPTKYQNINGQKIYK